MAQRPNISFIPKQSLAREGGNKKRPVSLFMAISIGLLVLSAGAYGGLYYYAYTLTQDNAAKEQQLVNLRNEIDRSTLQKAQRIEARLKGAETLVEQHVALSSVFAFLEEHVLSNVQLTSFSFAREQKKEGEGSALSLMVDGKAPDFASVISLRRSFLDPSGIFTDGKLQGVSLGDFGEVNFTFRGTVDPSDITYLADPSETSLNANSSESSEKNEGANENESTATSSQSVSTSTPDTDTE